MADENSKSDSKKKTVHWHGCIRCQAGYEDNCTDLKSDGLCVPCQGGRGFALLIENRTPRDCCRAGARLVTKEQKKLYRLAGAKLWFLCPDCARTHPFDPRRTGAT